MKKSHFLIALLLLISCNQSEQNGLAYTIAENDLIPEGITYSSTTDSFYLSSIFKTKIIQIDAKTGEYKDFISSDLLKLGVLGMMVDETRNQLWACANITRENIRYSTVAKIDLLSGRLIKSYMHLDSLRFTYNDLVLDDIGNVYVTNSSSQTIYKIDQQSDSVSLFYEGPEINYPNGITISPDNKYLYIASYDQGIRVLDLNTQKIIGEPSSFDSNGIDGLKYYKNSLIGIQNAVESPTDVKINRYYLDNSGTKITNVELIDQDNPLFEIPTTFVLVKDELYCLANSQVDNISRDASEIPNPDALQDILILRYRLK